MHRFLVVSLYATTIPRICTGFDRGNLQLGWGFRSGQAQNLGKSGFCTLVTLALDVANDRFPPFLQEVFSTAMEDVRPQHKAAKSALRVAMQSATKVSFRPFLTRSANTILDFTCTWGDFDAVRHAEVSL